MAMVRPTRYSVVSIGWFSSNESVVDRVPDHTGDVFSVTGPTRYFSPVRLDSTLTVSGAVTATGALVAATSVAIGGGTAITAVSSVTTAIDLPSIAGYATSTQTFGMSGLSRGDLLLYALDHDTSVLSNLRYLNIYVAASQTTAGEGTIGFSNNTNLTINQTSTVWRFTRIAQGAFV